MANVFGVICVGFVLLGLFIGGIALIIFGIRNRRKGEASQNWPSVSGLITNISIEENVDTDDEGFTSTTYTPKVEYQYEVGAESFTSKRISFGAERGYGRRKKAEEALIPYPVNSQASVFYNPSDPSESVLVQGTKGTMGAIIAGIVLIVLAACGSCAGLYYVIFG
ncbi:MAG: DUF3592 domain-containing protein [Anaerolineales bacterium]|jgi:hypothetical protein